MAAYTHLHRLRQPEALPGYLMRCTVNACHAALRRRKRETSAEDMEIYGGTKEEPDSVWTYVHHLPEKYRVPLLLRYGEDWKLADIARAVQASLLDGGFEIPHMKLLAWEPEGDFGKVDLLGADRPLEITRRFERPCTDIAVVLNANAACPAKELDEIILNAVKAVSELYQLEISLFKKECFNLGE